MKLLASLTSPYARKIRIILAEKALPFELVVDSPWEVNTRIPTLNPLGKVPVLITATGETFFDSPVIAGYLETLPAPPALLPADALDEIATDVLIWVPLALLWRQDGTRSALRVWSMTLVTA
ncbi:MAG TPA: glutathione S-transferase N-terminal domain-containing protein, partial [Thauera sp.]|nr:glutathione S-transferase N-terminal domain-containing protein [Thauera sp.]